MSLKIGLLTFHNSYNFGANLQTLATVSALQDKGVACEVLDYVDADKMDKYDRVVPAAQRARHDAFVERYLRLSPRLRSSEEIERYCLEHLSGIIVGSDAVFRLGTRFAPKTLIRKLQPRSALDGHFTQDADFPAYWLPWRTRTRGTPFAKTSIAASSTGTEFYFLSPGFLRRAWTCLGDFDRISVRDDWTKRMVSWLSLGQASAVMCPDPVFHLNRTFVVPDDEKPASDFGGTIVVSARFPRDWLNRFADVCRGHGYRLANLPMPEEDFAFDGADERLSRPLSPLSWYAILAGCAGYLGHRFHALVSCVANHVPVVSSERRPRYDLGFTARNKNADLCRRMGAPGRFVEVADLLRRSPDTVFEALFDGTTRAAADRYADQAAMTFASTLDDLVRLIEAKGTVRPAA